MGKLFHVYESDLAKLEAALPLLCEAMPPSAANRADVQTWLSECKEILSNIRWNYGPPEEVHVVEVKP
jgi:hypothetical protein